MKKVTKIRFTPPPFKCIAVSLAVIALSIVLCSAGCSNLVGGSGGGGTLPKELKAAPTVGSIIMKDGSLKSKDDITAGDTANAVAVVYKVAGGKAWAVGKKHNTDKLMWCKQGADAYRINITGLVTEVSGNAGGMTFSGDYQDGSRGLAILTGTDGVNDIGEQLKYPAWYYCFFYANSNGLPNTLQNGWYFPSVKELYDIWQNKSTVNESLTAAGGDAFTYSYWSSSQYEDTSDNLKASGLNFENGGWTGPYKHETLKVCAVRVFTY